MPYPSQRGHTRARPKFMRKIQEKFHLYFFISYAYTCAYVKPIYTCITVILEKTVPLSNTAWSDLGKLNVQAKKVHKENKTNKLEKRSIHNEAFILRTGWRDALFTWNLICPAQPQKKRKRVQGIRNMSNIMDSTFPSQHSRLIR